MRVLLRSWTLFPDSDARSSTPPDGRCALLDSRKTFSEVRQAAFNGDETNLDAVETVYDVIDPPIQVIDPLIDAIHGAPNTVHGAKVHPCRDKDRQHNGECDLDELTV